MKTEALSGNCLTTDDFEKRYVRPKVGRTLIIGSKIYSTREDRRKLYADALGLDMLPGDGVDHVINLEDDCPLHLGPVAHIDCISVLEHSQAPWRLAKNIQWLLKQGSTLYVQAPFVWRVHNFPSDLWRFTTEGIKALFPTISWVKVMQVHGGPEERLPNLWHEDRLYFCRSEICAFGVKT